MIEALDDIANGRTYKDGKLWKSPKNRAFYALKAFRKMGEG